MDIFTILPLSITEQKRWIDLIYMTKWKKKLNQTTETDNLRDEESSILPEINFVLMFQSIIKKN